MEKKTNGRVMKDGGVKGGLEQVQKMDGWMGGYVWVLGRDASFDGETRDNPKKPCT